MKTIYLTIITLLLSFYSYAQFPEIDIDSWDGEYQENAYYKDINNYFTPFLGTWVYTNGNTSFKIVLKKHTMIYNTIYYVDYITGEYEYIENGTPIYNTLSNTDIQASPIRGNTLVKSNGFPRCNNCSVNERRLSLLIFDWVRNRSGDLTLKLSTVNGQPALEAYIYGNSVSYTSDNPPAYSEMAIPSGNYIFIKE